MIRVETHEGLRNTRSVECSRVVVYDRFDNPIAFVIDVGNGVMHAATAEHPEFNRMLQQLGIDKVVVVRDLKQVPLDQIQFSGN